MDTIEKQNEQAGINFRSMMAAFERQFPLDAVFDRANSRSGVGSGMHLEIYKYKQLVRIADSLEVLANKMK